MSEEAKVKAVRSQPKTIEEEIAAAEERVRRLKERQREDRRKKLEKNRQALLELVKIHKLDLVPVEKWEGELVGLRKLLGVSDAQVAESGTGEDVV